MDGTGGAPTNSSKGLIGLFFFSLPPLPCLAPDQNARTYRYYALLVGVETHLKRQQLEPPPARIATTVPLHPSPSVPDRQSPSCSASEMAAVSSGRYPSKRPSITENGASQYTYLVCHHYFSVLLASLPLPTYNTLVNWWSEPFSARSWME